MTELETMQRAKMYMDKLAQGIDPITGQELPEDSALNQVRLARCFFYVSGILDQVIQNGGTVGPKAKKIPFSLTREQISRINLSAFPLRITEFVDFLYQAAENPEMKKLSTTTITNWLLNKGFLISETGPDGKSRRIPTNAGLALGLHMQTRQGQYGEYSAVYYNAEAQKFLLDNLEAILQEKVSASSTN